MDSIKSAPDTVIKTSITLAYVGLCLYLIISMAGEGKCFVRHAYTSAPADSFHANPLYQSTNLVMKPPPSKYLPMPSWISKEHPTQPPLLQVGDPGIDAHMSPFLSDIFQTGGCIPSRPREPHQRFCIPANVEINFLHGEPQSHRLDCPNRRCCAAVWVSAARLPATGANWHHRIHIHPPG